MSAVDAFYAKQAALEGLVSPRGAVYCHHFAMSFLGKVGDKTSLPSKMGADLLGQANKDASPEWYWFNEDTLGPTLRQHITLAETFHVTPEMAAIVTAAAGEWEPGEPVDIEDFPSPAGWLWIRQGLVVLDVRGEARVTSAISWKVMGSEVHVTWWADKRYDPPDQRSLPGWQELPRLMPWHMTKLQHWTAMPLTLQIGALIPPEYADHITWTSNPITGAATGFHIDHPGWSADQLTPKMAVDPIGAWLVTALRIMGTTIADVNSHGLPTGVRRDLMRRPVRVKNTRITVIEYRRTKAEHAEGTGREFSHRFLVRGHWRKQWRGSERNNDRRQVRIWIHPQIRGPEDKPIVFREHVNSLSR